MHSEMVIVLLVGLVASSFTLDLSHAEPHALESEPRLFGFFSDMYAQVIYPPMNHIVTNLALLGAQVLAGVADSGIRAPGGRSLHPSDIQLHVFSDALWNKSVRPSIETALSKFSRVVAKLLAGLENKGDGLGKRDLNEAEMRGFMDAMSQAFSEVFTNVIQKPMEDALSGGALMMAQLLAGWGTNGVNLSGVLGKRDLSELAGREEQLRGFFDTLGQGLLTGLQATWTNVMKDPFQEALQSSAMMAAQVLAGIGAMGVNIGKRSVDARGSIISDLISHAGNLVSTQVKPAMENTMNNAILQLAAALAEFSQTGFGRR